jgi:hypothetical protein
MCSTRAQVRMWHKLDGTAPLLIRYPFQVDPPISPATTQQTSSREPSPRIFWVESIISMALRLKIVSTREGEQVGVCRKCHRLVCY